MTSPRPIPDNAEAIAALLSRLSPASAPTPLLDLPRLAERLGVASVLAKDEGCRALGSFKSLGGTYAGLRALARAAGTDVAGLLGSRRAGRPALLCASAGNHGLAVAAAGRHAGAPVRIFLHAAVPADRARRIAGQGAEIVRVEGTYDDAVDLAAAAARSGDGILVPDTSDDPADPIVADVMAGYGVMTAEIRRRVEAMGLTRPTHLFVQAGVGGLAAAMAEGFGAWMGAPATIVAVEPEAAACVGSALAADRPVRIAGSLLTAADMLACGEASTRALAVLKRHGARAIAVSESALGEAPKILRACGGPATTPSGAAGLAGAFFAREQSLFGLGPESRVLVLVTEGALGEMA